jgi:hypothetical protein
LWALANLGYYLIFYVFGSGLSYNSAPVAIAFYFLVWVFVSIFYFWKLFSRWFTLDSLIWVYGALSLAFAACIWELLYIFSLFPVLRGPELAPYTDILFATPWYFLPKAIEIWVQQILISILILEFYVHFRSLKKVIAGYALCFGGAHVLLFSLTGAPTQYALFMTTGAVLSSFLFPYLILRVKGGFVYTYVLHLLFYIFLAMFLHAWPPPGYIGA